MPRQETTSDAQRSRERAEACRLARELGDNYVRIVMIVPASAEQRYHAYFVDSVGLIRCVKTSLTALSKPHTFKSAVRSDLGYIARHITEHLPRSRVTPAWRTEIAQAVAEGRRFMAQHPREYRFVKSQSDVFSREIGEDVLNRLLCNTADGGEA